MKKNSPRGLAAQLLSTLAIILMASISGTALAEGPEPLINDAFIPPDLPGEGVLAANAELADYYQTSEFMIGRVAVGIILIESDGSLDPSTEDWTSEEKQKVFSEIQAAMNWWAAREPRANLTFYYDDHFTSPLSTGYEPINRSHNDQGLWIGQVMGQLGYSASSYFTRVRDYNNALRNQYQTDWAFTIFVVDSSNDGDNKFSDGYFAYAYAGGPFMVMTYGNNGYGPGDMDMVAAHETGHIFRARDQYSGAHQACTAQSGWLQVENQNSDYGDCLLNEASIMKWPPSAYPAGLVDLYARGQIGWWDLDGDDILDPADPDVKGTYLYPYAPDPLVNPTGDITYRGLAVSQPYVVASIQWRDNFGPWQPGAIAADGTFNEAVEPFEFTLDASGLKGENLIQARLTDGNSATQSKPYGLDELTVLWPLIWLPIILN